MAGTYSEYPKNYERHFVFNIGTDDSPSWLEADEGITSRASSVSESSQQYYYMSKRGTPDNEVDSQSISRTFTGHRNMNDPLQTEFFENRFYKLEKRVVTFIDYIENGSNTGIVAHRGSCTISFSDDGSGETAQRMSIGFSALINGIPEKGTLTISESEDVKTYSFTPDDE